MDDYLDKLFTGIWNDLERATKDGKHPFRYPSLATYSSQAGVSQRTLVLRKVFSPKRELLFYSDIRTQKVRDLSNDNTASILFYHPKQRVQLRFRCTLEVVKGVIESEQHWQNIPETQKKDYASQHAPGNTVTSTNNRYHTDLERGYENFCLLKCDINAIDYLKLNREQHKRYIFRKNESDIWVANEVIP